jgi:hypothetical protein
VIYRRLLVLGAALLAYEVHLTNFATQPMTLKRVEVATVADGNSPLRSEGIPYLHDSFELAGRCRSFTMGCDRSGAGTRRREMPMANMLVRFPR